jgi:hypothetical protein
MVSASAITACLLDGNREMESRAHRLRAGCRFRWIEVNVGDGAARDLPNERGGQ